MPQFLLQILFVMHAVNGLAFGLHVPVSYTHLRAHETVLDLVCRRLLEQKKTYAYPMTFIHS